MENYVCKIATLEDIIKKHDYEIEKAVDDKSNWITWKEKAIEKCRFLHIIQRVSGFWITSQRHVRK